MPRCKPPPSFLEKSREAALRRALSLSLSCADVLWSTRLMTSPRKTPGALHRGLPTWIWAVLTTAEIPKPPRWAGEHQTSFLWVQWRELRTLSFAFLKSAPAQQQVWAEVWLQDQGRKCAHLCVSWVRAGLCTATCLTLCCVICGLVSVFLTTFENFPLSSYKCSQSVRSL